METLISDYEQQAIDFLKATGTTITITYSHTGKHFDGDKDERDIYKCVLQRDSRKYEFNFGNSLNNSGFYYTKGRQIKPLDRKLLGTKNLDSHIKNKIDWDFMPHLDSDKIHYPKAPTAYDILACLQKYDVGTFEDFCSEFGYDTDSKTAEKIYNAVVKEFNGVQALFTDSEIEQLQEIS